MPAEQETLYVPPVQIIIPLPDPRRKKARTILKGEVPSPINPPVGCRFHPRCPLKEEKCAHEGRELRQNQKDHYVSCHLL